MKKRDEGNSERGRVEIGVELEARVVAWVAGEASAFEAAELARIAAERPEVAAFKAEMERVHGLVGAAMQAEAEPLRLSAERRAKVLAALGRGDVESGTAAAASEAANAGTEKETEKIAVFPRRAAWRRTQWMVGVAATLAIGVFGFLQWEYRLSERQGARIVERIELPAARQEVFRKEAGDREFAVKQAIALEEKRRAELARAAEMQGVVASEFRLHVPLVRAKDAPTDAVAPQVTGGTLLMKNEGATLSSVGTERDAGGKPASSAGGKAEAGAMLLGTAGGSSAATPSQVMFGSGSVETATSSRPTPVMRKAHAPTASPLSEPPALGDARVFDAPVVTTGGERAVVGGVSNGSAGFSDQGSVRVAGPGDGVRLDAFAVQAPEKKTGVAVGQLLFREGTSRAAGEVRASEEAVSTFSLHVSDVSFRLAQGVLAARERGEQPENVALRAEEFYNAFEYGDPLPNEREKVAARIEQARHPVLQQRNLVRIGVRVAATGRAASQPLRLTLLLDTSGSMEREDRRAAVRRALAELVALLGSEDRVTLIGFARQPRLLAENVPGNQAGELVRLAAEVPAEGGTNLEEALKLAGEVALRHRSEGAQNRVVLLTDGAANLGDAEPARLMAMVESLRQRGLALDACGVGLEGAGDAVLEAMTRKGDGRYYVLDRPEAADAGFARKLAGAFRPAAENVKVQVRFNPARVGAYRLIGFERHRLNAEDFRNDTVDAAELAAEEGAVAMYQVEPLPGGAGDLGEVSVRFRDPASGEMVERTWTIAYDAGAPALERASASMQLAGVAAMLGEVMTASDVGRALKPGELVPVVNQLRGHYPNQARVAELVRMFEQVRRWKRE